MTKRQCVTCGYFEAAPSDGSGWCNHPRRKNSSDIRLLVRGGELPCRNDWNHDLWEDKSTFSRQADVVVSTSTGPLAPLSLDDVAFLTSGQRMSDEVVSDALAAGSAVDRVIREESSTDSSTRSPRGTIRGSVRRAHQHMLAEKRPERITDGAIPAFDGGFSAPFAHDASSTPSVTVSNIRQEDQVIQIREFGATRPVFSSVPPVQPNEMDRSIPKIAIYPGDDERFKTIPRPVDGISLPTTPSRASDLAVDKATFEESGRLNEGVARANDSFQNGSSSAPTQRESVSNLEAREELILQDSAEAPRDNFENDVDLYDPPAADASPTIEDRVPMPRHHRLRPGGLFKGRRRPIIEHYDDEDEVWNEVPQVAQSSLAHESEPQTYTAPIDRSAPSGNPPQVVEPEQGYAEFAEPLETALWTDVPRMCRTCRDFRPAETGDRGWCTNKWAFNHRRMVDAEERPCDSAVGCWWLPHDDIWLESSDISSHGQPTPLLDAWFGQHRDRDSESDSTPIRRRQRG